jgi:hypothetical protein
VNFLSIDEENQRGVAGIVQALANADAEDAPGSISAQARGDSSA